MDTLVEKIEKITTDNPNMLVGWYLILCYCYYELGEGIVPDEYFDRINLRLRARYDTLDHPHKHLISKENLDVGSGFDINYPGIVKSAGDRILKEQEDERALDRQRHSIVL